MTRIALATLLIAAATTTAQAQDLSLRDALQQAGRTGFANRISAAQTLEQSATRLQALRGILPTVRLDAGLVRTTDPIGAFGTVLRQRRITQQDFDPSKLNNPDVAANYMGAVVVEQPLINADAYLGRLAADRQSAAANAQTAWQITATRVDVVKAYYGAILAREKAVMLEAALKAARAHVDQAEKMVQAGLVTRSDALLASVKAGEVESQLIGAQGDAKLARRQLALVLGTPEDTIAQLPARLPVFSTVQALLQSTVAGDATRNDVVAAENQVAAAKLGAQRARSLYLPRLNGFARYDWNSPTNVFGGDRNWSLGVMASWVPFAGASEWAERRVATARAAAASAGRDAAVAQAALEIEAAQNRVQVALAALQISQRGAMQSAEAHRIVEHKYAGGLGSVTELLDAAASETQSELAFAAARYNGIVAQAERLRALGRDPGAIADILDTEFQGASR